MYASLDSSFLELYVLSIPKYLFSSSDLESFQLYSHQIIFSHFLFPFPFWDPYNVSVNMLH